MSTAPATLTVCPNVQDQLEAHFNTLGHSMMVDQMPFFEFLLSPLNRTGYSQRVAPGQGKIKTVELIYDQRILESEVTQPGEDRTCTATTERGNLSTTCEIDPADYWEVEEKLTLEQFRYICSADGPVIGKKIMNMINAMRSKIATEITTQAATVLGGWSSSVTNTVTVSGEKYLSVATLRATSGDIAPGALQTINTAKMKTNWSAPSPIFGGSTLYEYADIMKSGCCSAQGLNLESILGQYGTAVLYDRRVVAANAALSGGGDLYNWMPLPGALQVVIYNENDNVISESAGVTIGANYQKQIIFDPATGFPMDLTISDNCGVVSILIRANAKLCALPTDLFASGDHMEGVTFFSGIKVVNP
jgi:hypothetical protein